MLTAPSCLKRLTIPAASLALATLLMLWVTPSAAIGQTLQERIAHVRQSREVEERQRQQEEAEARAALVAKLRTTIEQVRIDAAPARAFVAWFRQTTGVPLIVNWRALEASGVDADGPISLALDRITAGRLLALYMQMIEADEPLVYEITPWYVRVLTRSQAVRHPQLRIYDVMDLVIAVPDFEAPQFDLSRILEADAADAGLFDDDPTLAPVSADAGQQQRGEQLADLVAQTIEPDIWQRNGGQFCSIRYRAGMLIVRAPQFVHRQIGRPIRASPQAAASANPPQADADE